MPVKRPGVKRVKVPDKKALYNYGKTKSWIPHSKQFAVPKDPLLLKKLGIEKGERILVFAGAEGNWANALAQNASVTYTDVAKKMTAHAKQHTQRIQSFRARDASLIPRRKNQFDWSFSFEPIPLEGGALHLANLRALMNKKGAKIVYGPSDLGLKIIERDLKKIARIYGASAERESKTINSEWINRQGVSQRPFVVFTLHTNPKAREMAFQDLRVLNALRKKNNAGQIAELLKIEKTQVLRSIARLKKFSGLMSSILPIKKELT